MGQGTLLGTLGEISTSPFQTTGTKCDGTWETEFPPPPLPQSVMERVVMVVMNGWERGRMGVGKLVGGGLLV